MAETTIIDISVQKTIDQVVLLKKSIQDLTVAQDTLNAEVKEGEQLSEEQAKQMEVLNAAVRNQKKEVTALTRVIDNSVKQRKAEVGSIEANRAELARLTAEIIKKAKPDEDQIKRAKALSDELKRQEGLLGDTRRNVGNYSSALEGAGGILKKFGVDTSGLEQKLKSARAALVETRQRLIDVQGNIGGASGASQGFGSQLLNLGKSLFTTTKGLQLLKVALISIGIGAIVVALGSMIALFAKSEKGLDLITKGFTIMGAVVDTLVKRVESFVTGMQLIFSGEFLKGIDTVTGSFKGLTAEISKTVSAASDLADAQDALEDIDNRSLVTRAKLSAQVQEQRELAQDENRTIQERIASQKEAIRIQAELSAIEEDLAVRRNEVARQTFELSAKTANDEKEFAQAQVQAFTEEENRTRERIKLKNTLDTLNNESAKNEQDKIKQTEELKKKALEDEKQRIAELDKVRKENIEKSIDDIQFETQQRKNAALQRFNEGELNEQEYQDKLKEIEVNALEERLAILQFYGENIQQAEIDLQTKILENQAAYNEAQRTQQEEQNELMREQYQADQDNFVATQEAKLAVANATVDALNSLLNILSQAGIESAGFQKALALTQIGIDTARSISAGIAGATTSATATGPGAFVATPIFIATTIATILGAIAQASAILKKTQPPKKPSFAEGGAIDINGASHSQGGAQVAIDGQPVAEVEGGEKLFVMKKSASAEIEKLSQWNQLFGGRSWTHKTRHAADGGQLFDGGFAARSFATNVNNQVVISELITASLKSMPTPEVKVTEINRVQRGVQQTVDVSSL